VKLNKNRVSLNSLSKFKNCSVEKKIYKPRIFLYIIIKHQTGQNVKVKTVSNTQMVWLWSMFMSLVIQ
jgi:hypothetical protein